MTMLDMPTVRPADRMTGLPVAIVGAGPVGLAAAAQLLERGMEVVVFEQGESAGAAVRQWGHTRLFSEWQYLVDPASVRLLEKGGWTMPSGTPNGHELVDPAGKGIDEVRPIRDDIRARIETLLKELLP